MEGAKEKGKQPPSAQRQGLELPGRRLEPGSAARAPCQSVLLRPRFCPLLYS